MPSGQFGYVPKVTMLMVDAPPGAANPAAHYAQLGLTASYSSPDATTKSVVATVSGATSPDTQLFAPMSGVLSYVPVGQATSLPGSFVAPAGGALQLHIWLMDVFKMTGQAPAVARDIFFTGFDPALTQSAVKVLIDLTDAAALRALWTKQNGAPPAQNMPVATLLADCFTYFMAGNLSLMVKSGAVIGRLPLTAVGSNLETAVTITANGLLGEFLSPIRIIRSLPWFDKTLPPHMYEHPLYIGVRKSVVIDPGHGGASRLPPAPAMPFSSANNASGTTSGGVLIYEKEMTLVIGQRCKPILERFGYEAILTRTADYNLTIQDRVAFASAIEAPAFVSVHFNAPKLVTTAVQGTETYCHTTHEPKSETLATIVQQHMVAATGYTNRGVKTANYAVISEAYHVAATASCLTEISFIYSEQSAAEIDRLQTEGYRGKLALALCKAIEEYISTWDD